LLGHLDQLFGGIGELRRQRVVLGQEPAGIGDHIELLPAQQRNRARPVDQGLDFFDLRQKKRSELRVEPLRSLLELADRPAELKGEDQQPLLLLADRGLRQAVGSVGGLLLHPLHRPGGQQTRDQRTQVFPAQLGRLSGVGQQLGEVVELTVVDEECGPQQPPSFIVRIEHPLH
jgi:hypothetical protein